MSCSSTWDSKAKSKLQNLLTICRKAGKLDFGLTPALSDLQQGRACGLLLCTDISSKSCKEAQFQCEKNGVSWLEIPFTIQEIGMVLGRSAGVLAVLDAGFFKSMQALGRSTE